MKRVSLFKNGIRTMSALIPLALVLIISAYSCAGSKKSRSLPPPPPPPPPEEVFTVVEEMPQYPGGDEALMKFLMENIKYPAEAKEKNIQGRVIVRFVVTYQGNVEKVEAVRGVDPLLDTEAVRVVSMLKGFTPGRQKGMPVNVWYSVPITFALKPQAGISQPDIMLKGSDTIYLRPSEPPQFPGGRDELFKFLDSNFKIPGETVKAGFQGSLMVSFFVSKDGTLSDFAVISGLSPSADAEALRVARLMPRWVPGKVNGRTINSATMAVFAPAVQTKMFQGEAGPDAVFVVVEEMPVFPGGEKALMEYIYSNLKYPEAAKEKGIQGRVILRFCVNADGSVDRISVIRAVSPELDAEAVRVIKSLPAWQPGKQGGKPVNVWYSVPVTFQLTGEKAAEPPAPPPPPKTPDISRKSVFEAGYDEPPVFPGGEKALEKFIESAKKYPQQAKINNITGTVVVGFTIDETGKVVNPFIFSGVNPELDTEAVRVVNSLTGWQPARRNGKPVKAGYRLAISFR